MEMTVSLIGTSQDMKRIESEGGLPSGMQSLLRDVKKSAKQLQRKMKKGERKGQIVGVVMAGKNYAS
jgi:DNA-binding protein YbaB